MIRDLALLGARLAFGTGFAAHGAQKALGWFDGPGPEEAAKIYHKLGFRPAPIYGAVSAWNEIVSGSMVAAGLGGPIGPALVISEMIVATTAVQWKNGFFSQKGGVQLPMLYAAGALACAATGFGSVSMDAVLGLRKPLSGQLLTALVLAGGVAGAVMVLNGRDTSPDHPATPAFRGKNSPLPKEDEPAPVT